MRRIVLALIGLMIAFPALAAGPAACNKRDVVLKHLASKYSEQPVAIGIASSGSVIEVLTSGSGSTWTIIVTLPNGISCLLAAGENWEKLSKTALGTGA